MSFRVISEHLEAFRKSGAWWVLAKNEVRQKYRRTLLGPNWLTLTTVVQIACLGPVYSKLFNQPIESYILYISIGITIWSLIVSTTTDFATLYVHRRVHTKRPI